MRREPLIRRYEHHHFRGFVVSTKRAGRRWVKYFSDRPGGRAEALKRARRYRDRLVSRLPWPARIKRTYSLNTSGVIGVSRFRERTRSGKWLVRYAAYWPTRHGERRKVTFSVARYGEDEARRLAVAARRKGVERLLSRTREAGVQGVDDYEIHRHATT